jgi:hypothetical protein
MVGEQNIVGFCKAGPSGMHESEAKCLGHPTPSRFDGLKGP